MSQKILIISGPTATGKTDLAVKIAKKFNGELINADSRQVYKGLDIGVGKDHPKDTTIHLLDLITPNILFSVAEFRQLALSKIRDILAADKLPIVVGGSGFYIDSIINASYDTFNVKPNIFLRPVLSLFPLKLLQYTLKIIDNKTLKSLNNSDFHNPRRLIRKIEIALSFVKSPDKPLKHKFDILHISLTAPNDFLFSRIDSRVDSRLKLGHLRELKKLLRSYSWNSPGLQISCYSVFRDYFSGKISKSEALKLWKYAEHADARHQKTWFKRYSDAYFVDVSKKKWHPEIVKKISSLL